MAIYVRAVKIAEDDASVTYRWGKHYEAEDGTLILSRELSTSGKNTCRVNSRPATVAVLKEIGEYLINIHGQNDNLELMNPALHIVYIAALADIGERLAAYRGLYRELKAVEEELNSADTDESERLRRMDLLSFQITELEDAFDITVPAVEIIPANFNSAKKIMAMIERLKEE